MRDEGWAVILRLIGENIGPVAMLAVFPVAVWATLRRFLRANKRSQKDMS